MIDRRWVVVAALVMIGALVGACGGNDAGPPMEEGDISAGEDAAGADATGEETTSGEETGMISSGQAEAPPPVVEPSPGPTSEGMRRPVDLEAAQEIVPFTVHVPGSLAEAKDAHLVVQLTEAREGENPPDLPALRLVYSFDSGGSLTVYQGPATGEPVAGEPTDVAGRTVYRSDGEARGTVILAWEQDDIRFEVRGQRVDEALLTEVITTLAPMENAG